MYCPQQLSYTIRRNDSLYHIAAYYQTTVQSILSMNPHIDPYNLQIGTSIVICPGVNLFAQTQNDAPMLPNCASCSASPQTALINAMRLVWSQHVYWIRMLLISIAERLNDQNAVTAKLLKNPRDIAGIFAGYYSAGAAQTIAQLLADYLQIGAALITALRDNKKTEADNLTRQWYINADKMAGAFSSISPYYNREALRKMLYTHLELTTNEVAMRLAKNYQADIEAFDKVEQEAMTMADYFSAGIIRQFPQKFIPQTDSTGDNMMY